MREVFKYLHREHKVTKEDYIQCLETIPLVKGMGELLQNLHKSGRFDVIIVSDANTFFIETVLNRHGLGNCVKKIYSNSAFFDEHGCLQIHEYHWQEFCDISAKNMCKGHILKQYLKQTYQNEGIRYSRINYAGDGQNDLCPSLKLLEADRIFPRKGWRLYKIIEGMFTVQNQANASAQAPSTPGASTGGNRFLILKGIPYPWTSGTDIWSVVSKADDRGDRLSLSDKVIKLMSISTDDEGPDDPPKKKKTNAA